MENVNMKGISQITECKMIRNVFEIENKNLLFICYFKYNKTQINFIVNVYIAINFNTVIKWFENKTKITFSWTTTCNPCSFGVDIELCIFTRRFIQMHCNLESMWAKYMYACSCYLEVPSCFMTIHNYFLIPDTNCSKINRLYFMVLRKIRCINDNI